MNSVAAQPVAKPIVNHDQLVAADDAPLVFIAVGTRPESDLWTYPDSGQWGAVAGRCWPADGGKAVAAFEGRYVADGSEVDDWEGE